jgi:hypothetical protein
VWRAELNLCYLESCQQPGATKFSHSTTEEATEGGKLKKLIFNHFICDFHDKEAKKAIIAQALKMSKAMGLFVMARLKA